MQLDLAALGISKEDLLDRVVERITESILDQYRTDEFGTRHYVGKSDFVKELDKKIQGVYDEQVNKILTADYAPIIEQKLSAHIFQMTNEYGEPKGTPMTVTEFFKTRIDKFLSEKVDEKGKSKEEYKDSYDRNSFRGTTPRLAYHIDKTIASWMQQSIAEVVKAAHTNIAVAIQETVRQQLAVVASKFAIEVKTK